MVAEPAGWPPGDYLWKKPNRLFHSFPLHKTKTTSPQTGGFSLSKKSSESWAFSHV